MTRKQRTNGPSSTDVGRNPRRQPWPLDVRLGVARAVVDEHLPASVVAERFGVPYTTVLEWCARYRRGGAAAYFAYHVADTAANQVCEKKCDN